MKIRKAFQGEIPENKILDTYSTSQTDAYSCSYVNELIESGSNNNGNWLKFSDGTMIITQTYTHTISSWGTWGSLYYNNFVDPPNYPISFVSSPTVSVSTSHSGSNFWLYDRGGGGTNTTSPLMGCVRPNNGSTATVSVYVTAIGKWK